MMHNITKLSIYKNHYQMKCVNKNVRRLMKLSGVFICAFFREFVVWLFLVHRGRSPPSNLDFKKIQIGGKDMENNRPKRRKDKYNPYTLSEVTGHYYASFKDGQGILQEIEISERIYKAFDSFELEDLVYLNVWDRHLEQSEVCEQTLNQRAFQKPEGIEERVLDMLEVEQLHKAIVNLPEVQRRRIVQYYFEGLTYQQIAREEHCSFQAVAKSISAAEKK